MKPRTSTSDQWRTLLPRLGHAALAVAIFAAIAWLFFFPNDINGDVLKQHDVMQGIANGQEALVHAQQTGEIPRWTDALFGGMPTFQIRPTYANSPYLSWVGKVFSLGFPEPVSWLFMMMLGFFILMLAFKVRWYLAVLGSVAYGLSSYFIILIGAGHIWKLLTLAYVAPTLAGIVLAYRGRVLAGSAVAALFAALQLAANHVQMTYYFAFVVVAMVLGYLAQAIREHHVGRWCAATGALLVAALLALAANTPNLYLTYKYSKETIRGGHSELTATQQGEGTATDGGLDKDYITQWSYGIDETATLLIANAKGGATLRPEHGDNHLLTLAETSAAEKMAQSGEMDPGVGQVLGQFPQYFGDQPMTNGPVYVGAALLALALIGFVVVRGPLKWALLAVSLLATALAWGHNMMWLTGWFIDHFPMYNKFRTPASMLVIVELTLPLMAVLGLRALYDQSDEAVAARRRKTAWIVLGATALLCLLTALAPGIMGSYSAMETEQLSAQLQQYPAIDAAVRGVRGALVSADAWRSLLFVGLAAAVLFATLHLRRLQPGTATALLTAIVLLDMFTVDRRYVNEDTFVPAEANTVAFVQRPVDEQILSDTTLSYRVFDQQHFAEAMPSYFHKTVGGYHAAKLSRYNDLITYQIAKGNMEVLNMLNTKYFIINDNQVQLNPGALGNAWFVDTLAYVDGADAEMAALDSLRPALAAVADRRFADVLGEAAAGSAGDTIALTAYAPNRLTYRSHSATPRLAVFSEVYFPWGWKVTVDGQPAQLGRVNYILRAMPLPAGDHTVEMHFDPDEVHQSETLATASIAVIFLALLAAANLAAYRRLRRQ